MEDYARTGRPLIRYPIARSCGTPAESDPQPVVCSGAKGIPPFEFFTPEIIPTYTITNDTTDRVIDANDTNIDEVADVLSTLIKDVENKALLGVGGARKIYQTTINRPAEMTSVQITHNFGEKADFMTLIGTTDSDEPGADAPSHYLVGIGCGIKRSPAVNINYSMLNMMGNGSGVGSWAVPTKMIVTVYKFY